MLATILLIIAIILLLLGIYGSGPRVSGGGVED